MSDIILLDTGPLGLVTHPNASPENDACNEWLRSQISQQKLIVVPGISDYELRREMIRIGSTRSIAKLEALKNSLRFAPITTAVMNQAALFWARARRMGKPTAADHALDGDMILSAHAAIIESDQHQVVIATTNVKHLELFAVAKLWSDIV
jgi:predicted nucleic acid-binding protein